jgi:hypothetical protein
MTEEDEESTISALTNSPFGQSASLSHTDDSLSMSSHSIGKWSDLDSDSE